MEDIHIGDVEAEERYHRKAFKAGVPVAAQHGTEYLVFAVEYICQDSIKDP